VGFIRLPAYWDQINEHLDGFLPDEAIRLLHERDQELEDAVGGLTFFQLSEFTAIVDSAFPSSDPANGKFKGIGEALNYYYALSTTTHIKLGVVYRTTTYTETASINWPYRVEIVGLGPGGGDGTSIPIYNWSFSSGGYLPLWDLGGFNSTASPNTVWLNKIAVRSSNHAAGSTTLIPASASLYAENCAFHRASTTGAAPITSVTSGSVRLKNCVVHSLWASSGASATVFLENCYFDFVDNTAILLGATMSNNIVVGIGCNFSYGDTSPSVSISHGKLFLDACRVGKCEPLSSTSTTLTTPTLTFSSGILHLRLLSPRAGSTAGRPSDFLNIIHNGNIFDIDVENGGYFQINSGADPGGTRNSRHRLAGTWETISNTAAQGCIARGPILMDVIIERGNSTVTNTLELKGPGVMANVAIQMSNGGATSVELKGTGLSTSVVNVALSNPEATVFVAGHSPFALDAASTKNIIHIAGASLLPAAGTDLGAANNIVQT
jgi:hypothetical protein